MAFRVACTASEDAKVMAGRFESVFRYATKWSIALITLIALTTFQSGQSDQRRHPGFTDVGREVTTFTSSKELLMALGDTAEAHEEADDRAKILHRDISSGNVLITDEGRGLLIDWDLAKDRSETTHAQGEQQPERTGTYQFMAARFVNRVRHLNSGPHSRLDDIESMFHVLQWIMLRHINLGLHSAILEAYLKEYLDHAVPIPGGLPLCAGRLKRVYQDLNWDEFPDLHPLLRDLLKGIRKIIATRYVDPDEPGIQNESLRTMFEGDGTSTPISDPKQSPEHHRLKAILETRGWLAKVLRAPANDQACPTMDESVAQIILKGTKSEINPTGPEYHYSSEKPLRKVQKGNDGHRNPPRMAKTKANSNLTEADIDNVAASVNDSLAVADDDPSESDGEGSSSQPKRRKSTNRKRKKNTN